MTRTWDEPTEYRDGPAPQANWPRMTPVVRLLIWSNAIVFGVFLALRLIDGPLCARVYSWFVLDAFAWHAKAPWIPLWQVVTYGFLHSLSDPFHILFNLLGIYFFGTMLEGAIGSRRYLVLFLTAVVIGAALDLGVSLALGARSTSDNTDFATVYHTTVGASGGVLATVVATAVLHPSARVIFIIFPMTLKVLALIMVGLDVFHLLSGSSGSTAVLVHLAGAAWGFSAVKFGWIWIDPAARLARHRVQRETEQLEADGERLDRLLGQIHERGIQSLSDRDRDFLRRKSARK